MMHYIKSGVRYLILGLLVWLSVATGLFGLGPLLAFDAPPADQGHVGPNPWGPGPNGPGPNPNQGKGGPDPIEIKTGNFVTQHEDLVIRGRIPLQITRTYNSQDKDDGPLGHGWSFTYYIKLTGVQDVAQPIQVLRTAEGRSLEFKDNGDGTFTSPPGWQSKTLRSLSGTSILTEKNGTQYVFNQGNLAAIIDRNGNRISLGYDQTGKLTTVTDDAGRTLLFFYGSNNKITGITDPAGRSVTYGYDANGNLISFEDPSGNTTRYAYDSLHRLTSITDPKGNTFLRNTYDLQNRLVEQFYDGGTWYFTYNPYYPCTRIQNPLGSVTDHYYNDAGNPTTTTYPTSVRTWDADMNMTSFKDPNGNLTSYTYDSKGNLVTITDPQANVTTFTGEPTYSQITSITDALGRLTLFEYDAKGNLTKRTDAAGNETTFTCNAYGDPLTMTNAAGTTHFSYNTYGYPTVITDPFGKQTSLNYDVLGNIISVTDRNGNATRYEYDKLNKLILSKNALGVITKLEYDANGNLTGIMDWLPPPIYDPSPVTVYTYTYTYNNYDQLATVTDILNNQISFTYDANGNLQTVRDGEGNIFNYRCNGLDRLQTVNKLGRYTGYAYDPNGNLTIIKDARGNAASYTYDSLNRLLQTKYPDGSTVNYTYNKVGRLISKTDQKGNTIGYNYNNLNRLIAKTYPDGSQATYAYDALGRLTSAVDEDSTVGFAYDALGRLGQSIQNGKTVSYEYDNMANKTKLTYPDGNCTTFTYDALNRLDQVKNALGQVLGDYTYIDRIDRTTGKYIDLGNGTRPDYMYDEINRLTSLTNALTSTGDILSKFAYTYDKNHNALSMTTLQGTHSYSYDKISQLTGVDYAEGYSFSDTTYSFDPVGNRVSTIKDGVTTAYASNNLNQYTNVGGTALTYDANGNLVSDGVNNYSYDYDNRLVQVITPADTVTFAYDALGRRISKASSSGTTRYIYDGYQSIVETDEAGTVKATYVYGTGIDEVLTMTRNGSTYYYQYDGLGSVVALTDSAGAVVEQYKYDVYGQPAIYDGAGNAIPQSVIGNSYMFTGREFDKETGIYYYRARYYSPQLGRFLQRDPLTWAPDDPRVMYLSGFRLNLPRLYEDPLPSEILANRIIRTGQMSVRFFHSYKYVSNNPAGYFDPFGYQECWPGDNMPGPDIGPGNPEWEWNQYMQGLEEMGQVVLENLTDAIIGFLSPLEIGFMNIKWPVLGPKDAKAGEQPKGSPPHKLPPKKSPPEKKRK